METTSIRLPIRNLPEHFDRSRITVVLEEIEMALMDDGERVKNRKDLKPAVERMIKSKKPYVLEVCVEKEDNVFPMIPSGASVSDIRLD